jgi:hypothetical protein
MANSSAGKDIRISINLITASSTIPPRKPVIKPIELPKTRLRAVAELARMSTDLLPRITRLNISLPNRSVPNGYFQLGGLNLS